MHWKAGAVNTKAQCVAKSLTWWEGRAYAEGDFNTAATCTGYCNDGNWPPKKTCGADTYQCNTQCAQCVPDDRSKQAVCINSDKGAGFASVLADKTKSRMAAS